MMETPIVFPPTKQEDVTYEQRVALQLSRELARTGGLTAETVVRAQTGALLEVIVLELLRRRRR